MKERPNVIQRAQERLNEEEHELCLGADNMDNVKYWAAYLDGAKAQQREHEEQEERFIAEEIRGYAPQAYNDW